MNKLNLVGLGLAVAAALVVAGCSDDSITASGKGLGRITPAVDVNRSILSATGSDASSAKSRAEAEDVSAGDLQLTIKSADGTITKTWASLADYDNPEFPVGIYTVAASYGSEDSEGFEAPYFYGESEVRVRDGETVSTGVTAALANCRFAFTYTEAFTGYIADWSADVHSSGGNSFTIGKDETRPVYVRPGDVRIALHIVKPNGKEATVDVATVKASARHHYNVTIDMNNGQGAGNAALVVEFDETLEIEPVEIELSDELFNVAAPELTPVGFTSGEAIRHIIGEAVEQPMRIDIMARAGIKAVNLVSKAPTLVAAGWPAEIDLMQASEAQQQALMALGLDVRGLWKNPDKMAVVDFTAVLTHIKESTSGVTLNEFTVTVTDKNGRVSAPVIFAVDVHKLQLALSDPSALLFGATTMQWTVSYNGSDLQENVKIQYLNELGNWSDCEITAVEASGESTYRVTITVPDSTNDHIFRATCSGITTDEVTVPVVVPEFSISVDERNVFAHRATVAVDCPGSEAADVAAAMRLETSTDGGNTFVPVARKNSRASSASVNLSNLKDGTPYTVRASIGSISRTATFSTEAALELENGDMELWDRTDGATAHWWIDYPGASKSTTIWGTLNLYTTSEGGNNTNSISNNRDGMAYTAISGTTPTTDAANGAKAALIRTVGWGRGNAVGGTVFERCNHVDRGELFLGTPVATLSQNYGIPFISRPASLTFNYKYEPRNSVDYGSAIVEVFDASGNKIASNTMTITAQAQYTQASLPLTYAPGAEKAVKLSVIFRSSENSECLTASKANLDGYDTAGVSNDKNLVGSKLYIDDIELTY